MPEHAVSRCDRWGDVIQSQNTQFFVMTKKTPTLSDLQKDGFESALMDQRICKCDQRAEPKAKMLESIALEKDVRSTLLSG